MSYNVHFSLSAWSTITLSKANPYLTEDRIQAYSWDDLDDAVKDADIIFTAIKSEGYILYPDMVKEGAIVFDLCLPRTCHPNSSITIHNIENITVNCKAFFEERNEIAKDIEAEISSELVSFEEWKQQLGIIPLIQEIREKPFRLKNRLWRVCCANYQISRTGKETNFQAYEEHH